MSIFLLFLILQDLQNKGRATHATYIPYEIFAVGTKRRLLEESRHEFVIFHQVNILLLQGTLAASQTKRLAHFQVTTTVITIIFLVRHTDSRSRNAPGNSKILLSHRQLLARLRSPHGQTAVLSRMSLRFVSSLKSPICCQCQNKILPSYKNKIL